MKRRHTLIIAALVPLALLVIGCEATGWAPGPIVAGPPATVPAPGLGTFVLPGERDTTIIARNIDGSHTKTFPSVEYLEINRLASPPLAERGKQQESIERMRLEMAIANMERALDKINAIASQWAPLMQTYYPPPSTTPAAPKPADDLKAAFAEALKSALAAEVAKRYPTSQPPPAEPPPAAP